MLTSALQQQMVSIREPISGKKVSGWDLAKPSTVDL
jgi:hypothetical protein